MSDDLTTPKNFGRLTKMDKWISTKVWKTTLRDLRMLHALTGEQMGAILDRIVAAELARVQREQEAEGG